MQKKWVDLFEKVVGRKPTPAEFMAGKESGFDFKQIKAIAGIQNEGETLQASEQVEEPVLDPIQVARARWLEHFEGTYGRKPSAEEFTSAKQQNFEWVQTPQTEEAVGGSEAQEYVAPQASSEPIAANFEPLAASPVKHKKMTKGKWALVGLLAALLIALGGGFYYLQSTTRVEVTADQMIEAVDTKNYRKVAELLSSDEDSWDKAEAESFVSSLEDQGIDIGNELNHIIENGGEGAYTDAAGNKIFGLEKADKKFGLFQEYRVHAYPLQVEVETNLDDAKLKINEKQSVTLKKGSKTDLGKFHFVSKEMDLSAKTEVGTVSTKIHIQPARATKNVLTLQLNSQKRNLEVEFPDQVENPTDVKVVVNGKEVGTSTTFEVDSIPYQEIEVHAVFNMNGETYTTEKTRFTVEDGNNDRIELKLAKDTLKRIQDANKAKKEKEAEEEQNRTSAEEFLKEYRDAVFSSVSNRSNTYSKYYDTQSSAYKEMVQFTTGGGVSRAKIDYYTPGALDIKGVTTDNGVVTVHTYEDFTVHYTDSTPNSVNRKNKTYTLKRVGNSYVITNIAVQDLR